MNIKHTCISLLLCAWVLFPGSMLGDTLSQQRNDFLLAEKLIAKGNETDFSIFSASLENYPLYPYLQYQWLKNNLQKTEKILYFLNAYKETRYAPLLRSKWLDYLAEHERWYEFSQSYQVGETTPALECQFYWSLYKTSDQQRALNEAKRLWVTGHSQPKACDLLFSALIFSPSLTPDAIWQRFELALEQNNVAIAEFARRFMDKSAQDIADRWLQIHKKPALVQNSTFLIENNNLTGRLFAHGIKRMAKSDLNLAIEVWDGRKQFLKIDQETIQLIERDLALALARKQDSRAYNRLNQLLATDEETREWKVRAALYEQNWQHIAEALAGLTPQQQQEPGWRYWQARAFDVAGNTLQAQAIYNILAEDRSFYGFLAADTINKPYQFADKPVFLEENQLESLANETDFRVIQELRFFNREQEAQRQWWFAISKLSKDRLMIAAKMAQQWGWDQIAIITLVKADYWDDLALRFPVNYLTQVQDSANRQNLDPALVYGLIRQESMLDKNAQSLVGAKGLMQIMPKTGQQIAHELNESWQSENSLLNPDINIRYGSYYYKQLLNRFNGHFALATAAYNAGPNRVVKWLPTDKLVAADVWIETIPYKETRKYVTAVLSYTLIYQQRIQKNSLKMKNLLRDVLPG